jgi:hypothetical protein
LADGKVIEKLRRDLDSLEKAFIEQNAMQSDVFRKILENTQSLIKLIASMQNIDNEIVEFIKKISEEHEEIGNELVAMKEQGRTIYFSTCRGYDVSEHVIILSILGDEIAKRTGGIYLFSVPSISWSHLTHTLNSDHHYWEKLIRPIAIQQLKEYEVPYIAQALANFEPKLNGSE